MPLKQILLYILGRRVNQALDHSAAKANLTKPDALFAHQVVLGGGQEAMDSPSSAEESKTQTRLWQHGKRLIMVT
ncbi:unnamed protein product [Timema podura]|uniref:Uncharacterized protein n=1 Tax=Timema podura TaxID=61482 RepID=A0ABN7P248_TIMPD|nr:unnamed protein product [Timema podura]